MLCGSSGAARSGTRPGTGTQSAGAEADIVAASMHNVQPVPCSCPAALKRSKCPAPWLGTYQPNAARSNGTVNRANIARAGIWALRVRFSTADRNIRAPMI